MDRKQRVKIRPIPFVKKSALLTIAAHLSKMFMAFILLKLIATYLGVEGMGRLGHLMSAVAIVVMLSGGGTINAIIKKGAEYRKKPKTLVRFVSASATYSIGFCIALSLIGILFAKDFSELIFKDSSLFWVIYLLVAAQFIYAFIAHVIGVSNGLEKIEIFSKIQILGSLIAIPVAWLLIAYQSFQGAVIAVLAAFCMAAIPALVAFRFSFFWRRLKIVVLTDIEFKYLTQYSLMLVSSALAFPTVEIVVRQLLIDGSGYDAAGLWQALIRITGAYIGFFSVFLAYYFVPQVIKTSTVAELTGLVYKMLVLISGSFVLGALVFYFGRFYFIKLFLSEEFVGLNDYILVQLIGDLFRVSSWVIGFVAVARTATKVYLLGEAFQSLFFVGLASWIMAMQSSGVGGVVVAYAITYGVYFILSLLGFVLYIRLVSANVKSDAKNISR